MAGISNPVQLALLLAAFLFSVVVALVTFILRQRTGVATANAIIHGGVALGGCLTLCIVIMEYLG